ncbi:hypothetical protein [Streptomyces microflavus]|uniref:Uncharacterized protein n=1 Tax=Streptomyces microflavus TaxID=1919 RepID=A0ABV1QBL3_STRMI
MRPYEASLAEREAVILARALVELECSTWIEKNGRPPRGARVEQRLLATGSVLVTVVVLLACFSGRRRGLGWASRQGDAVTECGQLGLPPRASSALHYQVSGIPLGVCRVEGVRIRQGVRAWAIAPAL